METILITIIIINDGYQIIAIVESIRRYIIIINISIANSKSCKLIIQHSDNTTFHCGVLYKNNTLVFATR